MKLCLLCPLFIVLSLSLSSAQTGKMYQVKSPDGHINLSVALGDAITWSVKHDETEVITPSPISITLADGETLGKKAQVRGAKTITVDQSIETPVYKKDMVPMTAPFTCKC